MAAAKKAKKKAKKAKARPRASSKKKAKKAARPSSAKRSSAPKGSAKPVLLGAVTHYFGYISVAIVKCKKPISVGDALWFKGATTDFRANVSSMQWEHKPISRSKKGQEVGIKVKERVREGDSVFSA